MSEPRPERATIAVWQQLDKLALDYRLLTTKLAGEGAHAADVVWINRTALQCAATRDHIAKGSIDHDTALAIVQAADQMFPFARDLVRARLQQAS